jgi:Rho GDP-dissociation inhibitor
VAQQTRCHPAANAHNVQIEGRPDIVIDLSQPGQLDTLKDKPFNIKEGTTFRMSVRFKVQHQILSGMKYLQVVKRMGISSKTQEMIVRRFRSGHTERSADVDQGSYSPNTKDKPSYEKKCRCFLPLWRGG